VPQIFCLELCSDTVDSVAQARELQEGKSRISSKLVLSFAVASSALEGTAMHHGVTEADVDVPIYESMFTSILVLSTCAVSQADPRWHRNSARQHYTSSHCLASVAALQQLETTCTPS
jgi:hypothetical protein